MSSLPTVKGQLGHGAQQLPREDVGVGQIDDGLLVGLAEEGLGVFHQILVERVLKAHKDGQGIAVAPPRAARLLPGGKHRPRVARDDDAVERADVDAHLQGVGRGDPREEAPLESVLDLAALLGKVACPVGGDLLGKHRSGRRRLLRPQGDELRHSSRCREAQRLQPPLYEIEKEVPRLLVGREGARAVEEGVVEKEGLSAAGRAVLGDDVEGEADELFAEFLRVGKRRRREDKAGRGAVEAGDAAQPADDEGHVGPEDPPVAVGLVEDDVAKVAEKALPLRVPGKHVVKLVGVCDDDPRHLADAPAARNRRVAVVDGRIGPDARGALHVLEDLELVVRQGLRGVDEKGRGLPVALEGLEDGQVEAEGLPRRGGRAEDDVAPRPQGLDGLALVAVEADVTGVQVVGNAGRERCPQLPVLRLPGRQDLDVGDAVPEAGAHFQRFQGGLDHGCHSSWSFEKRLASVSRSRRLCSTMGTSGPGFPVRM